MSRELRLFLQFLIQSLDGLTTGIMMEICLHPASSWHQRIQRAGCYFLLVTLICLPSYLMHYKILPSVNLIWTVFGTIYLTMKLYNARLKQAVILFVFYLLTCCFGELVLASLYPEAFEIQVDWTKDVMMEPFFTAWLLTGMLKIFCGYLYQIKGQRKAEQSFFPLMFTANLFIIILLLIHIYRSIVKNASAEATRTVLFIFGSYFTVILLFTVLVFGWQCISNRKDQMLAKRFSDLQNSYYLTLEKNSSSKAKLLHDYKNVLITSRALLTAGQEEEAARILSEFQQRLQSLETDPVPMTVSSSFLSAIPES